MDPLYDLLMLIDEYAREHEDGAGMRADQLKKLIIEKLDSLKQDYHRLLLNELQTAINQVIESHS
jgi:hypothetical protein